MDLSRRRAEARSNVVAGSVWESRIKFDEVRGGIKVFDGEEGDGECGASTAAKLQSGQISGGGGGAVNARRKTWKSEGSDGFAFFDKNSILIAEEKPESHSSSSDEQNRKSPIHARKLRSDGSPIEVRKPIPIHESAKSSGESGKGVRESGERMEKNSILSRKKMDQSRKSANGISSRIGGDAKQTTKVKYESKTVKKDEPMSEIEKNKVEIDNNGSDKSCGEFDECKEKVISSSRSRAKTAPQVFIDARDSCSGEEEEDDGRDEESEIEKENFDIKEINIPERKKIVNEVKKFHQINGKTTTSSFTIKQQPPPIRKHFAENQTFSKPIRTPASGESFLENKQKLHSLMDLLMWRDIIRSGLVFGIGTSIIILSFFTKNINISFITVMSYLGLLYLAAIFFHRSILCSRETTDTDDAKYMVGEEEAIWFAKLFLPYINELLQNLKALFRGDPATTMKLSVLLFVLAKCGSFITIWNVVKWGFVGVFTLPKFLSWCSTHTQLITHGEHWIKHIWNSWNSCPHKKGIAIAVFFVVWNFSSFVARLWAGFILIVTLRYYRQSSVRDGWVEEEEEKLTTKSSRRGQRLCNGQTFMVSSKQKREY